MLLNEQQQKQLTDHIASWEEKTSVEFVVVIAKKSAVYRHTPVLIAALVALLSPLLLLSGPFWLSGFEILLVQWGVFLFLCAIGFIPFIHRLITPSRIKHERASHMAKVQFVANNLHHTQEATGLLIFISEFEHHIEIIADRALSSKVTDDYWQTLVAQLRSEIKRGHTSSGLIKIVDSLGVNFSEHFPASNRRNELPDNIVVL